MKPIPIGSARSRLAIQNYFLSADDEILRFSNAALWRMLVNPARERVEVLAGKRVREVEVVVGFVGRKPVGVHRIACSIFGFDQRGVLDAEIHSRQQFARAALALEPVFGLPVPSGVVVDATERFLAKGGTWQPTAGQVLAISETALALRKCRRLTGVALVPT
jgi:hypothetical protein